MEKFALRSKTILGALLALIVNLAPFAGLSFSGDDAAQISQGWDAILNGVAIILIVWGRIRAKLPLRFNPFPGESGAVQWPLAWVVVLLFLAGCGTSLTGVGKTPAQQFYVFANQYALAKQEAAAIIRSGPLCSEQDVVTCIPDKFVIAVDDVTDEFDPLIIAATTLFESRSATPQTQQAQIALARQALLALAATLAAKDADS